MSPQKSNQITGRLGEKIAERYLEEQGYQVLDRNVRSPFGEIDLVANDRGTLVFIEVKTRRDSNFGFPEEAVGARKKDRMIRLASWYLAKYPKSRPSVRFDVLAIQEEGENAGIRLIRDAFDLE